MLAFAGGNIGDGPHWGVVLMCALLSSGSLVAIVALFRRLAGSEDALTIEHDVAAAIRMAAFMVSCGAILGIAVAGDWVSVGATVRDFMWLAWPAVVILVAALGMERLFRSSREVPRPSIWLAGIVPGLVMLSISAATVAVALGRLLGFLA
jgi:hypothetical protein